MLIQKPMATGDIITLKIMNGDEIVGKLISYDTTGYTLAKPVIVAIQPVGPTQVQLAFMPFMASSNEDTNIVFPTEALLTKPVKTRNDVANNYRRATANIEVATPGQMEASGLII